MSFRENLIHMRATHNMTQERLAVLLGVSRQAVTKWESEKSYPEMDKLLKLCQIFDCSLDDLIQGDLTQQEAVPSAEKTAACPPADVFGYDEHMRRFARNIPLGIAAAIIGCALGLPFFNASDSSMNPYFALPENIGTTIGALLVCLGAAVCIAFIIPAGMRHATFVRAHPFIEDFYTEEDKERARASFARQLVGSIICITLGICTVILFDTESENIFGVSIMLIFIAFGVFLIIHGGMMLSRTNIANYNNSVGEYLEDPDIETANLPEAQKQELYQAKKTDKRIGAVCGTIMIMATMIALLMLFLPLAVNGTEEQDWTGLVAFFWLPWPIGGLLCGIASLLIKSFNNKD